MSSNKLILAIFLVFSFFLSASAVWASYDLEVESLSVSPQEPALNEPCTVTIAVKNKGSSSIYDGAPGIDSVRVNFQDFNTSSIVYPDLSSSPWESMGIKNYRVEGFFFSQGQKNAGFGVDENNALGEINSTNNYNYIKVNVVPPYDLKVEDISLVPQSPAVNQDCVVTVKVKNNGFARLRTSTGVSAVNYNFSNFTMTDSVYPTIDSQYPVLSGQYFYYTYYGKFTAEGSQTLTFSIDSNNQLEEKDEDNNSFSKNITIVSANSIDLAVNDIITDVENPIVGEETVITVSVKNAGGVSLISDVGLLPETDSSVFPVIEQEISKKFADFTITASSHSDYPSLDSPLTPYSTEKKTFDYMFSGYFTSAGDKRLYFAVNTNGRLREVDNANNSLSKTVAVYADASQRDDFEIENVRVDFLDSTAAAIGWITGKKASCRMMYKKSDFTGFVDTGETTATEFSRQIFGLAPNTKYDYQILCSYGTVSKVYNNRNFFTPAGNYFHITGGPAAVITGDTAVINWTTDMLASSTLYYRLSGAADYTDVISKDGVTEHITTIETLPPGNYEYYIVLTNRPGVKLETNKYSFNIAASAGNGSESSAESGSGSADGVSAETEAGAPAASAKTITNGNLYSHLKGKIILRVEAAGEAYYVHPGTEKMYYLGRPRDAFSVMREQGVGITNADLNKIPVGLSGLSGVDTDGDGLPDIFEDAIGTDKNNVDTDSDGYLDYAEITGGYNPAGTGNWIIDYNFSTAQAGKILLQVESHGEAWYVNPRDSKRYFLGRPADAFNIMRTLGLGISNSNFEAL